MNSWKEIISSLVKKQKLDELRQALEAGFDKNVKNAKKGKQMYSKAMLEKEAASNMHNDLRGDFIEALKDEPLEEAVVGETPTNIDIILQKIAGIK